MIRLSSYLQDEEPFYILLFFWKEAAMDVISEIFDMIDGERVVSTDG